MNHTMNLEIHKMNNDLVVVLVVQIRMVDNLEVVVHNNSQIIIMDKMDIQMVPVDLVGQEAPEDLLVAQVDLVVKEG